MGTGVFRDCRNCDKRFEVSRQWQLFCCDNCRKKWNYIEAGFCFYCGEPGGISRDHVHPVVARGMANRLFKDQETVFACVECNSMLGGKIFEAIELRVKHLILRYKAKYKLGFGAVIWEEGELNELGPLLRQRVKQKLSKRQKAERRVCYLEAVYFELLKLLELEDDKEIQRLTNASYSHEAEENVE